MNKNIVRGLALAAVTGGFTILGATAANAIDLPDLDGQGGSGSVLDLGGIVDDLHVPAIVDVPVVVDGLNVGVLDNSTLVDNDVLGNDVLGHGVLGDGIAATTGHSTVDVLAALGIDTSGVLGRDLTTVVGVPVELSNTWMSIFGNEYNGIVVVPNLHTQPTAVVTDGVFGLVDALVTVPVDVTCSSVSVLSDYENSCTGGSTGGGTGEGTGEGTGGATDGVLDGNLLNDGVLDGDIIDGNLLDGELINDANGDGEITIEDRELGVLDGDTIDDPVLDENGVVVEGEDYNGIDGLDISPLWLSLFGENDGVVVVPDLTLDAEKLTRGVISHELLAPIVIDCVTVTALTDYERACASDPTDPTNPIDPTDPTDPTTPVVGGGNENGGVGDGDNGGAGNNGDTDLCAALPASATIVDDSMDLGALAAAALAGALLSMMLMLLGRRMGHQQ